MTPTQIALVQASFKKVMPIGEDAFTPDVKDAWIEVYGLLAGTMKQAAHGGASAAA